MAAEASRHVHPSAAKDIAQKRKKTWIPLENNPEIMTKLAHGMGLSSELAFHDVLSFDEPELLELIPRPCHALLFTFPVTDRSELDWRAEDAALELSYNGAGPAEPAQWYKQTIGHACGMIGLLHCTTNPPAAGQIQPASFLAQLVAETTPLQPAARAQWLYDSPDLERHHMAAAQTGDSTVPTIHDPVPHAYVAFVRGQDGELYELEGRRKGPIKRTDGWPARVAAAGDGAAAEDLLSEYALEHGVRRLIRREDGSDDFRFSCLALGPAQ